MQIGSLAEWVSGLATAGSLFLGFSILRRDRQKDDQAEAAQVVTWFINEPDGTVQLNVTNGGSRPIVHATFCLASVDEENKRAALWRIINVAPVLASGEGRTLPFSFAEFHASTLHSSYIQFRDANGISWRRDVRSGKLRRAKVGPNRRQRLRLVRSRLPWPLSPRR